VVVDVALLAGAVVAAVVAAVVEAVVELAVVVDDEDDPWFIICWNLWQPPNVSMSAAAQARTEIRMK